MKQTTNKNKIKRLKILVTGSNKIPFRNNVHFLLVVSNSIKQMVRGSNLLICPCPYPWGCTTGSESSIVGRSRQGRAFPLPVPHLLSPTFFPIFPFQFLAIPFNVKLNRTHVTPRMSNPLEATSVAMRIFATPVLKSSSACSRSICSL